MLYYFFNLPFAWKMDGIPLTLDALLHILSFIKSTEEFMLAMVCRGFYELLREKRTKRGQKVWGTDITVFCKTVEWTKFIILTSKPNLAKQWPSGLNGNTGDRIRIDDLYTLIQKTALRSGYLESYKFITNIIHYNTREIPAETLAHTANNYGFLRTMLDDLVPARSVPFVCSIIRTFNLPLIKALLTNNPELNHAEHCIKIRGYAPLTNNVLDYIFRIICDNQKDIDIVNAKEILNFAVTMHAKYCKKSGPITYTLDDYILTRRQLRDIMFLHEVIGVPGHHSIAFLALEKGKLDILEYTLEKQFPLSKKVATTIITKFPALAEKYHIVAGTE